MGFRAAFGGQITVAPDNVRCSAKPRQTPPHSPCDAHHHGDNDGDLDGADDGSNKDVVQLLTTRDDVEDIKVVGLVAQGAFVAGVTPDTCINAQHIHIHRTKII